MASSSSSERSAPDDPCGDWIAESPEVFYSGSDVVTLGPAQIERLKRQALINPRRRARLCAHAGKGEPLHEMLIVHHKDVYVRPHRHIGRSESLHVLEGEAVLVLFHLDGTLRQVVEIGAVDARRTPYCRIPADTYHTLLFTSEWFVFHEVVLGPFDPSRSDFASWAPADGVEATTFQLELRARIAAI